MFALFAYTVLAICVCAVIYGAYHLIADSNDGYPHYDFHRIHVEGGE